MTLAPVDQIFLVSLSVNNRCIQTIQPCAVLILGKDGGGQMLDSGRNISPMIDFETFSL